MLILIEVKGEKISPAFFYVMNNKKLSEYPRADDSEEIILFRFFLRFYFYR